MSSDNIELVVQMCLCICNFVFAFVFVFVFVFDTSRGCFAICLRARQHRNWLRNKREEGSLYKGGLFLYLNTKTLDRAQMF